MAILGLVTNPIYVINEQLLCRCIEGVNALYLNQSGLTIFCDFVITFYINT